MADTKPYVGVWSVNVCKTVGYVSEAMAAGWVRDHRLERNERLVAQIILFTDGKYYVREPLHGAVTQELTAGPAGASAWYERGSSTIRSGPFDDLDAAKAVAEMLVALEHWSEGESCGH